MSEFDPHTNWLKEMLKDKLVWGLIRRRFAMTYVSPPSADSISHLLIKGGKDV